jgi:metallo-beta-lactamase family protein
VKLRFLGAARQVTGSCYELEAAGRKILVDCGLYQERAFQERNWEPRPVDAASLHSVVLSHAHLDHCGLLPRLVAEGFRGPIYCTPPTAELAKLILEDSARIQKEDAAYKKRRHKREGRVSEYPYEPLTRSHDVKKTVRLFHRVGYGESLELGPGLRLRLHDAGHILGSAIVEFSMREAGEERRLVFTGDLGQPEVPIVNDPAQPGRADWVVTESTYGDCEHQRADEIEDQLAEVIVDTAGRGGKVVIPTFAIERAQELILHLASLVEQERIPRLRGFLDSPMAVDATEIFRRHTDFMDPETRERVRSGQLASIGDWFQFCRSTEESKEINEVKEPCIILAGSGMCTGGRIKHHLAQNVERPESTILFVGYQAEGTLGREILDGASDVRILGERQPVRARVRQVQGLSAHAGRDDLLRWLGSFNPPPRRVFVTHGAEQASLAFAERVRADLGLEAAVPTYLEEATLS